MSFTIPAFRQKYVEFVDPGSYPDFIVDIWAGVAADSLSEERWGSRLDRATELFVAHHLKIGVANQVAADAGGIPGETKGIVTSKTVDKVSIGYDSKAVSFEDQAFWNQTTYGIALYNLIRMFGAGGLQV